MTYRPRYDKGDWKAICDACGREFKASLLRMRWDGFMVCQDDWEPRQPQDFVRGVLDVQTPPWIRDEASDTYLMATTRAAIAGFAIAGAAISGVIYPNPGLVPPSTFTEP